MKQHAKEINEIGDRLYSQRLPIVSLWQEMALSVQARAIRPVLAAFFGSRTLDFSEWARFEPPIVGLDGILLL